MADLKVVIGALLDQSQAKQDLAAQLKKIGNLKVHVETDIDYQELTKYGLFQSQLAQTAQKRAQERRQTELRQAKAINAAIEADYKASQTTQTKLAQSEARRRAEARKQEESQARAIEEKYQLAQRSERVATSNLKELTLFTGNERISDSSSKKVQESLRDAQALETEYRKLIAVLTSPQSDFSMVEQASDEIKALQKTYSSVIANLKKQTSFLVDSTEWEDFSERVNAGREKLMSIMTSLPAGLSFDKANYAKFADLANTDVSDPTVLKKWEKGIRELESAFNQAIASMQQFQSLQQKLDSSVSGNIDILKGLTSSQGISQSESKRVQQSYANIQKLIAQYEELQKVIQNPMSSESDLDEVAKKIEGLKKSFVEAVRDIKANTKFITNDDEWERFQANLDAAKSKLAIFEIKNSAFKSDSDLVSQFAELQNALNGIKDPKALRAWNSEYLAFTERVKAAGKATLSFTDTLKNNISKFTQWFTIGGVVASTTRHIQEMYTQVKALDDSLTELRKVSDLTGASLESFVDKAFALGSEIGRTGQEVIDATTTFKRAGYTLDESLDLAEAALVMTNVGDNIGDTAEAASYLISVLKGFNLSDTDAMKVVDMINETSNNAAIDFDNIAEGLRRVSSTMSQTGTSLSETIGLLTGGFGQLRDIEMVSSGKQEAPYAQKCA